VIEPLVPLLFLPVLDEDIVVLPEMGTAVIRQENPCRVTASGFTMSTGWTALTVQLMDDDQAYEPWLLLRPWGLALKCVTVSSASFCDAAFGKATSPFRPTGFREVAF
jgi:hypothetical protein